MAGGRDAHFGLQARQFALHFFHRVVALLRLHAAAAAAAGRRMHTSVAGCKIPVLPCSHLEVATVALISTCVGKTIGVVVVAPCCCLSPCVG